MENNNLKLDWISVLLFFILVSFGLLNLFAVGYKEDSPIFTLNNSFTKQLLWLSISLIISFIILLFDAKIIMAMSYPLYVIMLLILIITLIIAPEIKGAKAWLRIGGFQFQPGEFAKITTAMALAKLFSEPEFSIKTLQNKIKAILIFTIPAILIILQKDTGTALVYSGFILTLYREGLPGWILILGLLLGIIGVLTIVFGKILMIAVVIGISILLFLIFRKISIIKTLSFILIVTSLYILSVDFILNNILKPHQRKRIMVLFNPNIDPLGAGWNITQAKIAIGSGGLTGKGFLHGTQTRFEFVPEQETDFIFCTIGEEHGWIGSVLFLITFALFMIRIIIIAENSRSTYARVFGYSFFALLFIHFVINIGMNIGYLPVIGIPLPFISYGGSHLMTFTIMFFILQALYMNRFKSV